MFLWAISQLVNNNIYSSREHFVHQHIKHCLPKKSTRRSFRMEEYILCKLGDTHTYTHTPTHAHTHAHYFSYFFQISSTSERSYHQHMLSTLLFTRTGIVSLIAIFTPIFKLQNCGFPVLQRSIFVTLM